MLSSAIHDLRNPNFWILNTDEEMPDICVYYKQLSSLVFVDVREIPHSTFSHEAKYFDAFRDFLSPDTVPEKQLHCF